MQRGQLKKSKQFQQESKQNRSSIWSTDSSRTEWIRYSPRMKGMLLNPPRCFAGNLDAGAAMACGNWYPKTTATESNRKIAFFTINPLYLMTELR